MDIQNRVLISVFVAVESAHAFSAFMPSTFTIRTFAVEGTDAPRKLSNLRSGYVPAVAFALALGAVAALLTRDVLPIAAAAGVSVFMITMYEYSIGRLEG